MCNLDDRLCVLEKTMLNQVIWSFDSDHKAWKKIYSINLEITRSWFGNNMLAVEPLAILEEDKLLYYDRGSRKALLVTHDPKTKSCDLAYKSKVDYFSETL